MDKSKVRYPQDFPRYGAPAPLPRVLPKLPEDPTPEQIEAHDRELRERNCIRFDKMNDLIDDLVDIEKAQKQAELQERTQVQVQERARPPMHPLPTPVEGMNMNRHESHCSVCQHPRRDFIEEEFIHWCSPQATADDFEIDVRALYRHARAFNLIAIRNRKIRGVLSHVLERAEHVATPSPDAIIRAVRAFTRVNDDGDWHEPPSHVVVSSGSRAAAQPLATSDPSDAIDISSAPLPAASNHKHQRPRAQSISSRLPRKKSPK
jgi:hypothetical protein